MAYGCTTFTKAQEAQVSRQAWPKPQVLTEIGDKTQVLAFLLDEWMGIQDFQRIDAPVLVAYLMGDDAARERAIADSFRNEAAMSALQKLYLTIEREVVYDGDVAKYQERYDAIGKEADEAAALWAQSARRWRGAPHAPAISSPRSRTGVKVAVGQRWRHVLTDNKGWSPTLVVSHLVKHNPGVGRDMHDYAAFENCVTHAMWLDDDGYCVRPDEWQYVDAPVSGTKAAEPSSSSPRVAVGQRWKSRGDHGLLEVVELANRAAARLSNGTREDVMMSLDENGFCKFPECWTYEPSLSEQMAVFKAEVGQRWRRRDEKGQTTEGVITAVHDRDAYLSTATPGELFRMPLGPEGRVDDRFHAWSLVREPAPALKPGTKPHGDRVTIGDIWQEWWWSREMRREGRVTGVLTNSRHGRHAVLEQIGGDSRLAFVMPLDGDDLPFSRGSWRFIRNILEPIPAY